MNISNVVWKTFNSYSTANRTIGDQKKDFLDGRIGEEDAVRYARQHS